MMNTFQFISSVGGAGAPKDNKGNKGFLYGRSKVKTSLSSFPSVRIHSLLPVLVSWVYFVGKRFKGVPPWDRARAIPASQKGAACPGKGRHRFDR